ncbi:Uncharacterised protein [Amycolatopsis camponoti]|uniref:Uncharacterized protein n=5 Tax=Amycolatopsis TaxID=1813 RepID=A0A6I8M0C0_9PSEU|nr:Uncharacterised protein [Amycolatopsis camponoti]
MAQTTLDSSRPARTRGGGRTIMWGLIVLSCVFVLVLGIAAVVDLRDHDRGEHRV